MQKRTHSRCQTQTKREHDGPTAAAGVGDGDGSKRTGREPGSSSADDMQHVSLSICVSLVPRILLPSTGCPLCVASPADDDDGRAKGGGQLRENGAERLTVDECERRWKGPLFGPLTEEREREKGSERNRRTIATVAAHVVSQARAEAWCMEPVLMLMQSRCRSQVRRDFSLIH